jgi:CheY-like chemotaxis protein
MGLVLIVDDHAAVARSLVSMLSASGFEARAVASGAEALAFVRSQQVALVLLDMSMPDMSGVEVLGALRDRAGHADAPPVVMFSADDDVALREEASRLGAIDFVSKTNPGELLRVVEAHVRPTRPPRA